VTGGWGLGTWGWQGAEKPFLAVIPIPQARERNLALSVFKTMRDSSSPAAPRNDTPNDFFRSLLGVGG